MSDVKAAAVDEQKVLSDQGPQTKAEKEQAQAVADYSAENTGGQPSMSVRVYSPFNNYYDGLAFSVSAENATGPFDILPKHHNFISLLLPCEMVVRSVEHGEQKIRISGGLIHVKADQVVVFLDV